MSQGAIFNLVLRDNRYDQYFQATDYLARRLAAIRAARARTGERNTQPTFADLERTHTCPVRATYRPFVAVASEYVRVKGYGNAATSLGPSGGTLEFQVPAFGHFTSDMVLHVRFRAIGGPGDAPPRRDGDPRPLFFRYCAWPGLRLLKRCALLSGRTLVDDYTADDAVAYTKHFVGADHRTGWARCHGQQETREATYAANGFTGCLHYREGAQTPRAQQPALELFIPLQFGFCLGPDRALLNDLIPNTQRTVVCDLAPLAEIVQALAPADANGCGYEPAPLPFTQLGIDAELYVNSLFVNPEVYDIFASRIGFSLFRCHRRQVTALDAPAGRVLLDQLKYPAEFFAVGFRDPAVAADPDRWWLMGTRARRTNASDLAVAALVWNDAVVDPATGRPGVYQVERRVAVEAETLECFADALGLEAHGIDLFKPAPALFFGAYLPARYRGDTAVVSPVDSSAFLFPFCLRPGLWQPTGYYNLSAGRELNLVYALSDRAPADAAGRVRAELVVCGSMLNFLIRDGDRIHLRYTT